MAVTEMTAEGYVLHLEEPWGDFPTDSVEADTERMNRAIERWVLKMPDQYLWTHRRFKTRPPGEPANVVQAGPTVDQRLFPRLVDLPARLFRGQTEPPRLGQQVVDAGCAAVAPHGQREIASFDADHGRGHQVVGR